MSEQKESSVLFSLKELMSLEEDRIRSEEADRAASAAAAERARLEAEQRSREAEEARIRSEEERRRSEEQRSREEMARVDAIRVGEIEKARMEAEQRARLEAMTAQQHHERHLASIQGDEQKHKLRKILIGVAIGLPILAGVSGFFVYSNYKDNQAQIAAQQTEQRRLDEERKKLEAQLKEQQTKVDSLLAQLSGAKDEATRLQLQKQLEEEREKQKAMQRGGGGGAGKPATGGGASKPCNCTPGDPLCSCL